MDDKIHSLRDALEWLARDIEDESAVDGEMSNANAIRIGFIRNMLARFPVRNCDVGTVKEQEERCWRHYLRSEEAIACPTVISGALKWAQMPYEEGGIK